MGKCASYLLLLNPTLNPPLFFVLICNSILDFADNISTLTTSVMLNSVNRQCWRRQQEERKNKGLFFFLFFSLLSCVMGISGSWQPSPQQQPAPMVLASSLEPISSSPCLAACFCSSQFLLKYQNFPHAEGRPLL